MISRRASMGVATAMLACCLLFASKLRAEQVPSDPNGFTNYVAQAFAKALPTAKITILGPLYVQVDSPGSGRNSVYLQNLYGQCQNSRNRCDSYVATWVDQISSTYGQKPALLDRAALRIVIRPSTYVDQLRQTQKQDPVAAPFIAGLSMICVADLPKAIEFPPASRFEEIGLLHDDALAACKQNTIAALRPMAAVAKPAPAGSIAMITGDPYESSRLLMPDMWAPLAAQSHGQLIVAVPGTDLVLYTQASDPVAVDALRTLTRQAFTKVSRSISLAVFRWTPTGFEEIQP